MTSERFSLIKQFSISDVTLCYIASHLLYYHDHFRVEISDPIYFKIGVLHLI